MKRTILFLCSRGGAKSVVAASYFNRLAEERALPFVAAAAAAEEPYAAVPSPVAEFLEREGFQVRDFKPQRVDAGDVRAAEKVVTIDCELTGVDTAGAAIERWNDVPQISDDLSASVKAIREHVEALEKSLRDDD